MIEPGETLGNHISEIAGHHVNVMDTHDNYDIDDNRYGVSDVDGPGVFYLLGRR